MKKKNESSSVFKKNKMTWKREENSLWNLLHKKEKDGKESEMNLENLTSLKRKLEKENLEKTLDRRNDD